MANLDIHQDDAHRAVWVRFDYADTPCFSRGVLNDVHRAQRFIAQLLRRCYQLNEPERPLFQIIASDTPGTFSLGGDLDFFLQCIDDNNRAALLDYARTCIEIQLNTATHYDIPVSTIAIVEGECLGGGFECALASEYLIADGDATFGFPELTFGMFPGMGALPLLLRKIPPAQARRMLTEQKIYSAAELHELGVVDQLATAGSARQAAEKYMSEQIPRHAGLFGIQKAMDLARPVHRTEYETVVEEWVDAAFRLQLTNRRLMQYLARAQAQRVSGKSRSAAVAVEKAPSISRGYP